MSRTRSALALALVALLGASLAGCCQKGDCIKDPPCKPCEQPGGAAK